MNSSRQVERSLWFPTQARQIAKRVIVEGDLVLDSPAHFGSGDSNGTELIILEDRSEKRPLLPGSSLAGALRHYLVQRENGYRSAMKHNSVADVLFGEAYVEERGNQSRVIVDDALAVGDGPFLDIRDSVKIDAATRTAEEGALFSTQVWLPGTRFRLHFELNLYSGDDISHLQNAFAAALDGLGNSEINMGTRKHRGYGQVHVENWQVAEYDLHTTGGLLSWIRSDNVPLTNSPASNVTSILGDTNYFDDAREFVRINARFTLDDTMLIRAGSDTSDMAHLAYSTQPDSGNQLRIPIISGTSLAGVLRARALKILNTLGTEWAQAFVDDLFGAHGSEEAGERHASRLITSEQVIHQAAPERIQNRVKIDRFTGGAFETALFEQQPVFAGDYTYVDLTLELRCPHNRDPITDAEIGLFLLVLKDLWTGDLPLGGESNVGRGRLHGAHGTVTIQQQGQIMNIDIGEHGPDNQQDAAALEYFVSQLHTWLEGARA